MTGVSEKGKEGLLWTIFEGEPFCSRRVASFGDEKEALEYLRWKEGNGQSKHELAMKVARCAITMREMHQENSSVQRLDAAIDKLKEAYKS